jgi:hypothetical protein
MYQMKLKWKQVWILTKRREFQQNRKFPLDPIFNTLRYSYACGKFKHAYTGLSFRKVAYTGYDVTCSVELMNFKHFFFRSSKTRVRLSPLVMQPQKGFIATRTWWQISIVDWGKDNWWREICSSAHCLLQMPNEVTMRLNSGLRCENPATNNFIYCKADVRTYVRNVQTQNSKTNVVIKKKWWGQLRILYQKRLRDLCPLLNTDVRDKMGWTRSSNKGWKKMNGCKLAENLSSRATIYESVWYTKVPP